MEDSFLRQRDRQKISRAIEEEIQKIFIKDKRWRKHFAMTPGGRRSNADTDGVSNGQVRPASVQIKITPFLYSSNKNINCSIHRAATLSTKSTKRMRFLGRHRAAIAGRRLPDGISKCCGRNMRAPSVESPTVSCVTYVIPASRAGIEVDVWMGTRIIRSAKTCNIAICIHFYSNISTK